jgi:copper chaperone CopZ
MEAQMIKFTVANMTCGACVARIRGALKQVSLPPEVEVDIDLAQHQVRLTKGANPTTAALVREAIEAAGYTAVVNDSGPASQAVSGVGACCPAPDGKQALDANQAVTAKAQGCCS